ncbi:unnamed protein product [Aspergillus oryzae]|uniref:Unnamed protein product n=1 Tax=Aspergillus oryzae TaxID=5062 RepID=A0AAN5C5A5_ASPOZ|nr:unnamed protein product [Aspergillus oryzae]
MSSMDIISLPNHKDCYPTLSTSTSSDQRNPLFLSKRTQSSFPDLLISLKTTIRTYSRFILDYPTDPGSGAQQLLPRQSNHLAISILSQATTTTIITAKISRSFRELNY